MSVVYIILIPGLVTLIMHNVLNSECELHYRLRVYSQLLQFKLETNPTLMIKRYAKIVCIVLNFYHVVIDRVGVEFSLLKRVRNENCNV